MKPNPDPRPLLERLQQIAADIVTPEDLERRVTEACQAGRPLRVKFGIDPTFPDVHIGHAVPIRVLRLFQEHGHLPILLLGDGTARLGDPTGRNDQRPPLSEQDVAHNSATYLEQIGKILDLSEGACEIRRNGAEWFNEMGFFGALRLASRGTVARLIERDDFQKRMNAKLPIHLHEMMYPLMQGWDSVELQCDVEIGGNDQLFNLHMGRLLQEREGQRPQVCLTVPLLVGTDGRKMSKSYGNHVPLLAEPNEVYGKVMSLSDEPMRDWFRLLTDLDAADVETLLAGHPREAKGRLAHEVTAWLHDAEAASAAATEFERRFKQGGIPEDIDVVALDPGEYALPALIKGAGLVNTTSEARRIVQQGGFRLDGEVLKDVNLRVPIESGAPEKLLQAGKRRFAKVRAGG